jgi:hypothetical protein
MRVQYPITNSLDESASAPVDTFRTVFDEDKVRKKVIPILMFKFKKMMPKFYPEIKSGTISVRVIEFFFTKFLYSHPVRYWKDGDYVDVLQSYKRILRKYGGKKGIDVYRRGTKINVEVGNTTLISTTRQIRCFTWMEERGILDWLLKPSNTQQVLHAISEYMAQSERPKLPNRKNYAGMIGCERIPDPDMVLDDESGPREPMLTDSPGE